MLLFGKTERKTESAYKKKNLYIYIYRQKEKEGANGHKKRETKKQSP